MISFFLINAWFNLTKVKIFFFTSICVSQNNDNYTRNSSNITVEKVPL